MLFFFIKKKKEVFMRKYCVSVLLFLISAAVFSMSKDELINITVFHDNENPETLKEIDALIGEENIKISQFLGVSVSKRELYIYKNQKEMQKQKHPILSFLLKPDWYIGDNINQKALIVSPNTSVKGHSYESIIHAIPHEYVHTVVYSMNKKCNLWINEGLALYLANKETISTSQYKIPPVKIFSSNGSIFFSNNNGYQYADKFIEYINEVYGHDVLIKLIKDNNYTKILGVNVSDLYNDWKQYLIRKYP
jgi:hypothetical protein